MIVPDPAQAMVTPHFTLAEFACRDGTSYPIAWLQDRLVPLCLTLEVIRAAAGGGPIHVLSGYRTLEHNRAVGRLDTSQHVQGRAADIQHGSLTAAQLHQLILELYQAGKLPLLGGLGQYASFVHVDIRQRVPADHLARWVGSRVGTG